MADRSIIGARRVPSTSLNEDYYTYIRSGGNSSGAPGSGPYHPGSQHQPPQHSLRPAESRFSLREQFSTTRREIEFGFDDASSIFAPSTFTSEAGLENDLDDTASVNDPSSSLMPPPPRPSQNKPPVQRSHYELLCLPNDPSLTPNDIRRAFHRVVQNLCVGRQPKRLQLAAASYLGQVQLAFETLIEPYKRAEYDMSLAEGEESSTFGQDAAAYQASVLEQYMLHGPGGLRTTTDLGTRVDTSSLLAPAAQKKGPTILDLSLRQSITTDLPALKEPFENAVTVIRDLAEKNLQPSSMPIKRPVHRVHPTLTVTGSTHSLMDESFKLASVLQDPYRPPGPSIHGARRLDQLLTSRFLPGLSVTTRQENFLHNNHNPAAPSIPAHVEKIPSSVLEQELEILPFPSVTLRAGHSIKLPEKDQEPLNIEVSIQKPLLVSQPPTIGLALDKKLGPGTAFLVADAGDWENWNFLSTTPRECRELSRFSQTSGGGRYLQKIGNKTASGSGNTNPFRNAPTVEIGYAFGKHANEMGVRAGTDRAFTRPSERGLRGMDDFDVSGLHNGDGDSRGGSWTISTGLSSGTAAAYLRYGKDLFTNTSPFTSSSASPKISRTAPIKKRGFRTEIEVVATAPTSAKSLYSIFTSSGRKAGGGDILLAFRTMKYIGRFTKVGFEVGLTANNLYLSLYWSRLGQRISIPFLIAASTGGSKSTGSIGGKLVFWTTVVPFAAVALWEGFLRRVWSNRKKHLKKAEEGDQKGEKQKKREKLLKLLKGGDKKDKQARVTSGTAADEDTSSQVAQQRAEADELTVILATGVENRQKIETQRGGLVILSAKYGVLSGFLKGQQPQVLGAEDETENEIADVTVALAAIVDEEGRLNLPAGLKKGKLLGFWDPAPGLNGKNEKTLWVRYLYRGKESVVEVGEGEELNLP